MTAMTSEREAMTLETARVVVASHVEQGDTMSLANLRMVLSAIDAHLSQPAQTSPVFTGLNADKTPRYEYQRTAQPAQAVDVVGLRGVADALRTNADDVERYHGLRVLALHLRNCADKLTAALTPKDSR